MQKTFETYHSSMSSLLFQIEELPSKIFVNQTKLKALWIEMEILKY